MTSARSGPHSDAALAGGEAFLHDVVVIIPALNEERSLPLVLRDLPPVGRVIVVDNGSSDRTSEVARQWEATVVREPRRGYGAACLRGLRCVREVSGEDHPDPRVVVFLDADYSDHPNLLPKLVSPILDGDCDLVLGSRLLGCRQRGAMPPQSVFGNRLACTLMRWLFNASYTDLGPFRAVDYQKLCQLGMSDQDFGWTIEMQIKAAQAAMRVVEIPVPYRRRIGTSKISGSVTGSVKAGAKILYTIGRYRWQAAYQASTAARPSDNSVGTVSPESSLTH